MSRQERDILECAQLSFVIVHALIAHFPQGILQLITAEQQLSARLRAAPQVNVQPIERLLEILQLHTTKQRPFRSINSVDNCCSGHQCEGTLKL